MSKHFPGREDGDGKGIIDLGRNVNKDIDVIVQYKN